MKAELQQKLYDRWPQWFIGMSVVFEHDDGWFDLELRLCEDLEKVLGEQAWTGAYKLYQVKEKFGMLRWQALNEARSVADAVLARVLQAERESAETCERCGSPGRLHSNGTWLKTMCSRCAEETGGFEAIKSGSEGGGE